MAYRLFLPSPPDFSGKAALRLACILRLVLGFFGGLATFPQSQAQSLGQLDLLVFDPVPLDSNTLEEVPIMDLPLQLLPVEHNSLASNTRMPAPPFAEEAEEVPGALDISRNIAAYNESVRRLVAEEGPFSPSLFEILVDLASQYQLAGEHEQAIEALERAEHVSRVNNGLYHPEQYDSIERMIDSYIALGEYTKANQKQRYLIYLSEQHYGETSPATLPSLVDFAEISMDNFNRAMASDAPVMSFSTSTGPGPGRRPPTPKELAFGNLFVAQQHYIRAITTMIDNKNYFDPMLLDLEYGYLETLLLQSFRSAILDDPDYYLSGKHISTGSMIKRDVFRHQANSYRYGNDSFERILIYLRNNPEAKIYQLVNALMEYGDWNMLFGRTNSAQEKYREAHSLAQKLNVEEEVIDALFRPGLPVHLPLITAKPNSREKFAIPEDAILDYVGYIDVAFTISRFGKARSFNILATSGETTRDIERRLLRYLRNSPFRPYMKQDENFIKREVTLRYYFTFADQVI